MEFLGLPHCNASTQLQKLATRPLGETIANYQEMLDAVRRSRHASLLDAHLA